jgi:hypothetical protein
MNFNAFEKPLSTFHVFVPSGSFSRFVIPRITVSGTTSSIEVNQRDDQ